MKACTSVTFSAACAALTLLASPTAEPLLAQDPDGFVPLFNGRDLTGWVPLNVAADTFFARDGTIVTSGVPTGLMRTARMYENFILELEWRHMKEAGNSGVFTWAELGVLNNGFGNEESKGGRRCWNSDETGTGDNACGWATFNIMAPDRSKPLVVEMDVRGESDLSGIVINTQKDIWTPIRAQQRLSRKPQWDTLEFRIPPEAFNCERVVQHLGFGGADSQIWVAAIRVRRGE